MMKDLHTDRVRQPYGFLHEHQHGFMAGLYHEQATFRDIAFDLQGQKRIHAMWHRICEGDIIVEIDSIEAVRETIIAHVVDRYTFTKTLRKVVNRITSQFRFCNGLIIEHHDTCNELDWARQAFGGIQGELAGRLGVLRRRAARKLMNQILEEHPEYR